MVELEVNFEKQLDKWSYGDDKARVTFFRNYFTHNTPLEQYVIKYNSISYIKKYYDFNIYIHTPEIIITINCNRPYEKECADRFNKFYTHLLTAYSHNENEPTKHW